eukprot:sb/3478505/
MGARCINVELYNSINCDQCNPRSPLPECRCNPYTPTRVPLHCNIVPHPLECLCNPEDAGTTSCDVKTGDCTCATGFTGDACTECAVRNLAVTMVTMFLGY